MENNVRKNSHIQLPRKTYRIIRDVDIEDLDESSTHYKLNVNTQRVKGSDSNEEGVDIFFEVSTSIVDKKYYLLGHCLIDNKSILTFWTTTPNTSSSKSNLICLIDDKGNSTKIIEDNKLNFNLNFNIKPTVKKNKYGETLVYWVDPKIRWLNIDSPQLEINSDFTIPNDLELKKLNLVSDIEHPEISINSIFNSGNLESGIYQYYISYSDKDDTFTSWIPVGTSLPIYKTQSAQNNSVNINGGIIGENSNKAVSLKIFNINTNLYKKVKLACIRIENGIQQGAFEIDTKIINQGTSSVSFLHNKNTENTISLVDINLPPISYPEAQALTQIDNQLIVGGVKVQNNYNFQKYAKDVKLEWFKDIIEPNSQYDYADNILCFNKRGYQDDEVYSFYIHLVYKDGRIGEGFHIPGRAPVVKSDLGILENSKPSSANSSSIGSSLYDSIQEGVEILGSDKTKLFHIRDTSFIGSTNINGKVFNELGYWENENETYPDDVETWGSLANQKVRHHKMPSCGSTIRRHIPSNTKQTDIIGLRVSNVVIPEEIRDDVQGYTISYVTRTETERSVFGQFIPILAEKVHNNNYINTTVPITPNASKAQTFQYCSSFIYDLIKNKTELNQINCVKQYNTYEGIAINLADADNDNWDSNDNFFSDGRFGINTRLHDNVVYRDNSNGGRLGNFCAKIESISYIRNNSIVPSSLSGLDVEVRNLNGQETIVFKTNKDISNSFSNTFYTANSESLPNAKLNLGLCSLISLKEDMYFGFNQSKNLTFTGKIHKINSSGNTIGDGTFFGGDCFVNYFSYRLTEKNKQASKDKITRIAIQSFVSCYENIQLRTKGEEEYQNFIPSITEQQLLARDLWESNYFAGEDYHKNRTSDEIVLSNIDLSSIKNKSIELNRIIISDKDNLESDEDGFRNFTANNYYDLATNRGKIVDLITYNNKILIHLERTLLETITNDELKFNEVTAFLGTGDIFRINPREPIPTNIGYAGINSKYENVLTERGYFFIDVKQRKIFRKWGDKLIEISLNGMTNYFYSNLSYNIQQQLNDVDFEKSNISNPYGVGCSIGYDPEYKRIFIAKRDYKTTDDFLLKYKGNYSQSSSYLTGDFIVYDKKLYKKVDSIPSKGEYISVNGNILHRVILKDELEFNNITISNVPDADNSWESFFSFSPSLMYNTDTSFFTNDFDVLYIHNVKNTYCRFYDSKEYGKFSLKNYLFIVDIVGNPKIKLTLDSVSITTRNVLNGVIRKLKSFDKYIVYNDYQCSLLEDFNKQNTSFAQDNFNINKFRNMVEDENIKIEIIEDNPTNVNPNKPYYKRGRLKGNYFVIRLICTNLEQNSLSLLKTIFNLRKN